MADDPGSLRAFLQSVVRPAVYGRRAPLEVAAHHLHGEPVPVGEAVGRPFAPFPVGGAWGGMWDTTWFRFRGAIPDGWAGAEVVALVHLGGDQMVGFTAEGQVWDAGLRPVQGLHHQHREFALTAEARGGEPVEFYVEAAANPIPPWHLPDWPLLLPDYRGAPLYTLGTAELAVADRSVEGLYLDMRVLAELAALDPDRAEEIHRTLDEAREIIDPGDVSARATAARDVLSPLLDRRTSSTAAVVAVGHAHIDCAWLWPLRETRRKCARTFSNQLRLLERYPEHRFACSQAVQYQWMKDDYPELFGQIREQVRAGRWEPVGGMWVEPDTNVPSGESLVRQLVHGKRFFADEFGVETHELWIPDVFGYSAALPQIAREAGVTSLITQKMSWNDTNPFPHTSFWWEGHDGSRLLAHFPPANTYNGDFSVGEVAAGRDRGVGPRGSALNLYPFGYGDGGGGPSRTMVERFRRVHDLDDLPRTQIGTVAGFLEQLGHEADDLPVWVGELYLEAHRATLTTHADVKSANRRAEEALRAAELWSVAASLDRRTELDRAWKLLLLHQFHDILPGSSIHWVYEDTAREQAEVLAIAGSVVTEAQTVLAGPDGAAGLVVFNPSSTDRREVVDLPDGSLAVVSAPACGWSTVSPDRSPDAGGTVTIGDGWLDNGLLRVEWDGDGLLTSVRDLAAGRQVLADGARGNLFQVHDDHPKAFDAWDVDRTYLDQVEDLVTVDTIDVVEDHPLRGGGPVRPLLRGLDHHPDHAPGRRLTAPRVPHRRRVARAAPVPEGGLPHLRPVHPRHLRDPARPPRAADRGQHQLGRGAVRGVRPPVGGPERTRLRGGPAQRVEVRLRHPGEHHPALAPARPRASPTPTPTRARTTSPMRSSPTRGTCGRPGSSPRPNTSTSPCALRAGQGDGRVVSVDRPGVSVEAVKWADRSGAVVVRLCEVWGARGPVRVTLHLPFGSVARTDVLERVLSPLASHDGTVELELRPFELVTLAFDPD